ncbi:class I SAM-dependent methyltransferase [Granulicella aggregans]|uniref:class I SAM-dependent methyltransferase n=1 Tax=Granulicella aggregans TaxID=474949 RepID=UPI00161472E9
MLTEKLARHCDLVTAFDFSAPAALQAKTRCASLAQVDVRCASITDAFNGEFDLLVLSEIGYYFSRRVWQAISWRLLDRLAPGAVVVAAHWLGTSEHHSISGDEVHEVLRAHPGISSTLSTRSQALRLDRFVRL